MIRDDPTELVTFMNKILKWTRVAKATGKTNLDILGDGQVATDGTDIDAAVKKGQGQGLITTMTYYVTV